MRLSDLFYLNKSDRQVLLVLLTAALTALTVAYFISCHDEPEGEAATAAKAIPAPADSTAKANRQHYYNVEGKKVELFAFDPNTADSTALLRLGLQPWQVRSIYRYRAAGGVYREKADFARLYGLTVKKYRELEPYIEISADYRPASTLHLPRQSDGEQPAYQAGTAGDSTRRYPYTTKINQGETVDLNALDTTLYKMVPGIGSYYARRIAEYGRRLGGYVSTEQLREIDNFPMESAIFFDISTENVRRLNVNKLSLNELKRHPYINYYQARAIVDYRRQQGLISDLHELQLLDVFPEAAIARLLPYVEY